MLCIDLAEERINPTEYRTFGQKVLNIHKFMI